MILVVLVVGLVGTCLTALLTSPLVAVRHVVVKGLASLAPDEVAEIRAQTVLEPNAHLFRVPTAKVAGALRQLPFIARVSVTRRFPDRLDVTVVPRQPVAILSTQTERWELDLSAVPIRRADAQSSMPEIVVQSGCVAQPGVSVDAPGVAEALSVVALAERERPLPIAKIQVDQNVDICLNMQDTMAIRLGQVEDLHAKLSLVRRMYAEEPDIGARVESIDLRCAEAPACLPRETAAKSSEAARRRDRPRTRDALPIFRRSGAGNAVLDSSSEH